MQFIFYFQYLPVGTVCTIVAQSLGVPSHAAFRARRNRRHRSESGKIRGIRRNKEAGVIIRVTAAQRRNGATPDAADVSAVACGSSYVEAFPTKYKKGVRYNPTNQQKVCGSDTISVTMTQAGRLTIRHRIRDLDTEDTSYTVSCV